MFCSAAMHGSRSLEHARRPIALTGLLLALAPFATSCREERAAQPAGAGTEPPARADASAEPGAPAPGEKPSAQPADPDAELSALLRRASTEPASVDDDARVLFESLALGIFPATEGELAGSSWQVQETVGAMIAELHAELVRGAEKLVGIDVEYHADLDAPGVKDYGTTLVQGYPATERNRFLFVLVGHTELRMQGFADPYRSLDGLHALLARFPLQRIGKL